MLELSYESTSTFRGCPKKYYWKYVEDLEPVTRVVSLSLGSILHEAFDLFSKGMGDREVYQFIADKFNEEISRQELADQEDLVVARYTALAMWLNYPYKTEVFEAQESEMDFCVPLMWGVRFRGRVDGKLKKTGNWWVREYKTSGLNHRQFEARCSVSAQGTGYVFGLFKQGNDIKGIMYEYIKKPMLRKGINETADEFGHRIMQDYKVRPALYFTRIFSYRNPVDLRHFEEDMRMLAQTMKRALRKNEFYRNLDSCWNYGSECPFAKICYTEKPDPLTVELYFKRRT